MSSYSCVSPGKTIGIVGGGQLGKMVAIAAAQLGYGTHVFTHENNAPATKVTNNVTIADFNDTNALLSFAKNVDVVTLEFENIPHTAVEILAKYVDVYPCWQALYISQNRLREKELIGNKLNIPVVDYTTVENYNDLKSYVDTLSYPALLKTAELGYDGKGQYLIKNENDLDKLCSLNWHQQYILEKFIKIHKEISLIVAVDAQKKVEFFPIAENYHVHGILDKSIVPAEIDQYICEKAQEIAIKIATSLNLVGILAVEFFITDDGNLLVNEIAPRPHNSGHWSLNACNISQFEQLVRAICGLPLKPVKLLFPCVMQNILGENIYNYRDYINDANASLTVYGKDKAIENRKMGHVNILQY